MAINILPPVALVSTEQSDISILLGVVSSLYNTLQVEERITVASGDRLLSTAAIDSINTTITDASDRIDAIINPTISV